MRRCWPVALEARAVRYRETRAHWGKNGPKGLCKVGEGGKGDVSLLNTRDSASNTKLVVRRPWNIWNARHLERHTVAMAVGMGSARFRGPRNHTLIANLYT